MKKVYFLAFTMALGLASCNQKSKETTVETQTTRQDTMTTQSDTTMEKTATPAATQTALYSCPMHPEVKGEKDSECPKCGMKLTEPVKK